jgi:hypothetical protein
MSKQLINLIFAFVFFCASMLQAQNISETTALKIADRIINSTTYTFINKKTQETYTSVKDLPLRRTWL